MMNAFTTESLTIETGLFPEKYKYSEIEDPEYRVFLETLHHGEIPASIPSSSARDFDLDAIQLYSSVMTVLSNFGYWGAATKNFARAVLKTVGKDSRILDPLAGIGWMTKALREVGIPVAASDSHAWPSSSSIMKLDALTAVERFSGEATHILLSWPPYEDPLDVAIVEAARKTNSSIKFIYIGEHEGGCTGTEDFWNNVRHEGYIEGYKSPVSFRHDAAMLLH